MPGDRVRKEVEDILEKDDRRSKVVRMAPPPKRLGSGRPAMRLTPGALMLVGLALVVIGLAVPLLRLEMALAAAVVFLAGYAWSIQRRRPGRRADTAQTYWRGEPVTTRKPATVVKFREPLGSRVRRLFRRK
jgi:Flp pilus assembly protein TadB